jgi:hypothetical protein
MLRSIVLATSLALSAITVVAALLLSPWWWLAVALALAFLLVAVHDVIQRRHSILRNFPVLGHARFMLEKIRPEVQQYFIERNFDGRPYARDVRSVIYERAKGIHGERAFGTERDVGEVGYEFLLHSTFPLEEPKEQPRARIGGPDCTQPYDSALLNVSAMSFGALSANALMARGGGDARLHRGRRIRGGYRSGAAGIRGPRRHPAHRWPDHRAQRPGRHRPATPDRDRCQREGRHRQRYPQAAGPRRRLHQRGPGDDDGRRLHSGPALPHQHPPVAQALQITAAMGLTGPDQVRPEHLMRRIDHTTTRSYSQLFEWLAPGELLHEPSPKWAEDWKAANPDSFRL